MFKEMFGYEPDISLTGDETLCHQVHPDDLARLQRSFRLLSQEGKSSIDEEYRHRTMDCHGNETFIWCRMRAKYATDSTGALHLLVGTIANIHEQKRQLETLEDKTQRDALTGQFNKSCIQDIAERTLAARGEKQVYALFIIDLDNFHLINETYGHWQADILLKNIAQRLLERFSSGCLVGRSAVMSSWFCFP